MKIWNLLFICSEKNIYSSIDEWVLMDSNSNILVTKMAIICCKSTSGFEFGLYVPCF